MNAVITTLIILIASIVLGTGVVLYGTSIFNASTNNTSDIPIVKQVVSYHMQGIEPTIEIGNYTKKSFVLAVDPQTYKLLLTDGETVQWGNNLLFNKNGFVTNYYDGNDINDIVGSKVIIDYSVLKPTCVYVFDWGNDFQSMYHVDTFNFTKIPNATKYDFVPVEQAYNSCNDNIKNIQKVEVYLK